MSKEIALALSGGGMRGCAHIGAIKRLEELSLKIKVISGTSVGAMIGSFVADGFCADEVNEIILRSKFRFNLNFFHFKKGLFRSQHLEDLLKNNLRSKRFEELKTELIVCVTNYKTGKPEYLTTGNLVEAILASSAIPMLYNPVTVNGVNYIDGGVSRNLPSEILKKYHLPIIGIHLNPMYADPEKISLSKKMEYNVHLSILEKVNEAKEFCNVHIEPEKLIQYSLFDTKHLSEMIRIGYDKTKEILDEKRLLALG